MVTTARTVYNQLSTKSIMHRAFSRFFNCIKSQAVSSRLLNLGCQHQYGNATFADAVCVRRRTWRACAVCVCEREERVEFAAIYLSQRKIDGKIACAVPSDGETMGVELIQFPWQQLFLLLLCT